jgi:hypothetical protein
MNGVRRTAQSDAIGFVPIAVVPPVRRLPVSGEDAGGTTNPQANAVSRGCEFNQLAPHTPERLDAPRLHVSRQHHVPRGPPLLASIARHGYSRSCQAKITDFAHLSYTVTE